MLIKHVRKAYQGLMKIIPLLVQQSPMIDLEYEDISNVPLPPLEEGEISSTSTDHLSVLIVGEGPMTNRTGSDLKSIKL